MRKIYSKVNPEILLHVVNKKEDITPERQDLSPDKEYLQVSCFKLEKGKKFKPHKHLENIRTTDLTQESWIIIQGSVKAILYDIDDTIIEEVILNTGDCSITFRGGHNYESLEEDSIVYEYKMGPYQGVEKDKVSIGED
jgi:cupin fold WbuC family metalloprotein